MNFISGTRAWLCAAMMIVMLVGTDGRGAAQDNSAAGDCKVVFGMNFEFSGAYQVFTGPAVQGIQKAADDINKAGGVRLGKRSCKFVVAMFDNKSDPSQVFTASQQVINAGALFSLGPSLNDLVAYNAFRSARIIEFVTGGSISDKLNTDPSNTPYAVALIPFPRLDHTAYLKQARAVAPDLKSVVLLEPQTAGAEHDVSEFTSAFQDVGLKVAGIIRYPDTTKDFSTFLTQIKGLNPDLLIPGGTAQQVITILQQAAPLGVAKYYLNPNITDQTVLQTPALSDATVFIPNWGPTYSSNMVLPNDHPEIIFGNAKPPLTPGAAIVMYYAAFLAKQAVEKADSLDPDKVFAALKGQSYNGPFGRCTMNTRLFMECPTAFIQIRKSKVTAQQFASPYDTKPIATYSCESGKCTRI